MQQEQLQLYEKVLMEQREQLKLHEKVLLEQRMQIELFEGKNKRRDLFHRR